MSLTTMARAQLWEGGNTFRSIEVELPDLGPGELLVELRAATICGSDRHTVSGRRPGACPSILGHEGVGEVVASRRPGVDVGQRVVFAVTVSCGRCRHCRRGLSAKCESVRKAGHESFAGDWQLSGTYATHLHVLAGQSVAVVPDGIPDAVASTAGCAVATVMAVLERAGDLQDRTVLVNGIGMLGMIAVAAARSRGARHIIACDPNPDNLRQVTGIADELSAPGVNLTVDVALEFSGVSEGAAACLQSLDIGGTAVFAGTVAPVPAVDLDPEWLVRGWRTVTGVHNFEPRHLDQAVAFLAAEWEQLRWEEILGEPITLRELPAAFRSTSPATRMVVTP